MSATSTSTARTEQDDPRAPRPRRSWRHFALRAERRDAPAPLATGSATTISPAAQTSARDEPAHESRGHAARAYGCDLHPTKVFCNAAHATFFCTIPTNERLPAEVGWPIWEPMLRHLFYSLAALAAALLVGCASARRSIPKYRRRRSPRRELRDLYQDLQCPPARPDGHSEPGGEKSADPGDHRVSGEHRERFTISPTHSSVP